MNNTIHSLLFLLCVLLAPGLRAQQQSLAGYIEAGEAAEAREDFYNAYTYYKIATEWDSDSDYENRIDELRYRTGLAAYNASAYRSAQSYMAMVANSAAAAKYPLARFYQAQAAYRQGQYDMAATLFQQFIDQQPAPDPAFVAAAERQTSMAGEALERLLDAKDIVLTHLPKGINTELEEVSYTKGPGGALYFTSNAPTGALKDSLGTRMNMARIMKRTGEETSEVLDASINLERQQVANTAFNTAGTEVYFSVCQRVLVNDLMCDLYRAPVNEDGTFGEPTMLSINSSGYNTTQPSVGMDNRDGREYLFFASDRPGGAGGLDLYRAPIGEDGTIGEPNALTDLNTPDTDGTPFWYTPTQTLYFSTDGRFTFGGMDLYQASATADGFSEPRNLGHPINSSANDAYLTRFPDDENAYMASRRVSANALVYNGEEDLCCYELYQYPIPPIELIVTTFHSLTQDPLAECTVTLYEITPGGDTVMLEQKTDAAGNEFFFEIEDDRQYYLTGDRDQFIGDTDGFDLNDSEFDGVERVERQLYLTPGFDLDVYTFNSIDEQPISGATVELYEVSEDGVETLLETTSNATGNDYHWTLPLGKIYLARGFTPDRIGQDNGRVDARSIPENENTRKRIDLYLGQQLDIYVVDASTREPIDYATLALTRSTTGDNVREKLHEGNHFQYIVNLDQDFISAAAADGYFPRTDTLTFTQEDLENGGGKLVFEIPLTKAEPPVVKVYFDNDYPNPGTRRTTTSPADLTYEATFLDYQKQREEFVAGATSGMDKEAAFEIRTDVNQFFEERIEAGMTNLEVLADWLTYTLPTGRVVNLLISGSASPRAGASYNKILSMRRIDSVKNYLEQYNGGSLLQYMTGPNKTLTFDENPQGENSEDAKAPGVSDAIDRPALSIYSPKASEARHVIIRVANPSKK